jgi:Na+-driven multidrug efflux pump
LGAAAIGASIYDLCLFLPLGLIDGIQIIIGRRAGESKYFEIGSTFNQGLYLLFLSSILMTIFLIFLTPYLSEIVFSSGDITSSVVQYTQIVAFGIIFHSINLLFSAFYVGIAQTRVLIGATIILAITNIILDYLLIFGNFGFPRLGIRGAAIGSIRWLLKY